MLKIKIIKQKLIGGLGDEESLSDFDPQEVEIGMQVEMEHTNNESIASEIVADHLSEDPKYYTKLKNKSLQESSEN